VREGSGGPAATTRARRLFRAVLVAAAAMGLGCHDDGNRVEISGLAPPAASAKVAAAICKKAAACGNPSAECSAGGSSSGGSTTTTCTATLRTVEYADCYEDAQPDIEELLSCPSLTAEYVDRLEACANDYAQIRCVTQGDLDAWVQAPQGDPPRLPKPPSCEGIEEGPPGCESSPGGVPVR
jgi:hypothetical protein